MIIAVVGRRVSPPGDQKPRFPESRVDAVRSLLEQLMREVGATALVSSGARGTDLLAMQAAGRLGLDRWMVLPFDPKTFRESSVVDGTEGSFRRDWGHDFDEVVDELTTPAGGGADDGSAKGGLIVLGLPVAGENQDAYEAANDAILDTAERLARQSPSGVDDDPRGRVLAVIVWEGEKRGDDDHTWSFREKARARNLPVRAILTVE
jgi:hypothetical protein